MTTLFLVRHGQTEWGDGRYAGDTDLALSPLGVAQAARLGTWARTADLDAIVTSPLARAVATADPAAQATGIAPTVDPRLREVSFGLAEGLTAAEMAERFPEERAAFLRSPATTALPGGESGRAALERALPALGELRDAHPDGRVLVVTHNTVIRLVLCALLGLDPDRYREVFPAVGNAALTTVRPATEARRPAALLGYNVPL
ncbi:histidine phosphatase family protein [Agromyces intestinalis]|uniref:Histidine phosphatase family protein n=1 Tax=Agromyces intestinalis TaxID=2592652 RepID=A0A5C1YDR8_9MICO|nr:histidine phosphatase family protein [Agromyces intestinalis]QEO14253.1 histidine phosphatase family protein [Agromyces intestinalis]